MLSFEGFHSGKEKDAVIFDIGTAYTKCGFAGEPSPRFIIPTLVKKTKVNEINTPIRQLSSYTSADDLKELLVEFFHQIFYRFLLVNARDHRVVIVESLLCRTEVRETMAKVLFTHFEVPSLLFAPAHLISLFTLGIQTGLVLDCGYQETLTIPVYEGYPILNSWQYAPLAGKAIHKNIENILKESATFQDNEGNPKPFSESKEVLSEEILEDIKVRACLITPMSRGIKWAQHTLGTGEAPFLVHDTFQYPVAGSGTILNIPSRLREVAPEILFELDGDQVNLPSLILDTLLACSVDLRKKLAENILLIGGTCQLPGFKSRIKEELQDMVKLPKYSELALKTFKFHNPPGHENFIGWLGGAMFGALEALPVRSLSRDSYMEKRLVPDWSNILEWEHAEEQSKLTRPGALRK